MSKEQWVYSAKNSFSSGELTPTIEGRNDLPIYQHGVKKLINFMILPSGGITRRHGTQYAYVFKDKIPIPKCMATLMYLREYSFLIVFSKVEEEKTKIEIFINGEGQAIELGVINVSLDVNQFTYTTYQGAVYISFGASYPVWVVQINPEQIEKLSELDNLEHNEKKELFHYDVFKVKGNKYDTEQSQQNKIREVLYGKDEEVNEKLRNEPKKAIEILKTSSLSIFEGRLWAFGNDRNIHEIWASCLGAMNEFNLAYNSLLEARNPLSAFSVTFISSTFDNVLWSIPFAKELLIATTDGIYVLTTGDKSKNEFVNIHKDIDISVAPIPPIICGKTIFFVEGDRKKIHSLYYSEEKGGYQISCITTYSEHLFNVGIKQIVSVNSPFNMIFAVLNNGSFATFTYSQDLKIMGWSQHWLGGDGKVVEAIVLYGTESDKVYFRVLREGTEIEKESYTKIVKEYLEYFDCKYLSGNILSKIHEPLYADCYSHFKREGEDEIDLEFKQALRSGNVFEYKEDLSKLEHLIVKQAELEREFSEDDIINSFYIGNQRLREIQAVEGIIDNSDESIPHDDRPIITLNVQELLTEFIKNYFQQYLKPLQLVLGLEIAIIRKIQNFVGCITNVITGKEFDIQLFESLVREMEFLISEFKKQHQIVTDFKIHWYLKSTYLLVPIKHKSNSNYSFVLQGMVNLTDKGHVNYFAGFEKGIKRLLVFLRYYCCSFKVFSDKRKKDILKEFNIRSNYQLLTMAVNSEVDKPNLLNYIERQSINKQKQQLSINSFESYFNDFIIRSFILNNLSCLEENFINYFLLKESDLIVNSGYLEITEGFQDVTVRKLQDFFTIELAGILAIIYNSYAPAIINPQVLKEEIYFIFKNFVSILGIVREEDKESLELEKLVNAFIDQYLLKDINFVLLVNRKYKEWKINDLLKELLLLEESKHDEFIRNIAADIKDEFLIRFHKAKTEQDYLEYQEILPLINDLTLDDKDTVELYIEEQSEVVQLAITNKWKENTGQEIEIGWFQKLFNREEEKGESLISWKRLVIIGALIESKHTEEITSGAINDIENDFNVSCELYFELKECSNMYLVLAATNINNFDRTLSNIFKNLIHISSFLIPSENFELLRLSEEWSHPTKIDKYLLLSREYFPIFRENFPDVDIEMIKTLIRHINAGVDKVESEELHKIYGGMKVGFIGDNELISNKRLFPIKTVAIPLNRYVRFLSFGFVYSSVLRTFPLIFEGEFEHMDKKDTQVGLKLFNTKGGYIEESGSKGNKIQQFINAPRLNLDNIEYYLSDKKYLTGDAIRSISTPYISGWVHFSINNEISKDVDLVYVIDKPYPASILKIYAKTKLIPHYLN